MSYVYRIKPFATVAGLPVVPGAHHVSAQANNYYVAYKLVGRTFSTLAVIYKEAMSGLYLAGAEPDVMATFPGGSTLQALVEISPANWGCWICDTIDTSPPTELIASLTQTLSIASTMSLLIPVQLTPTLIAIGGKPTAPYALASFDPVQIEETTTWIGDHLTPP